MTGGTEYSEVQETIRETPEVAEAQQQLDRAAFEPAAAKEQISDYKADEALEKEVVAAIDAAPKLEAPPTVTLEGAGESGKVTIESTADTVAIIDSNDREVVAAEAAADGGQKTDDGAEDTGESETSDQTAQIEEVDEQDGLSKSADVELPDGSTAAPFIPGGAVVSAAISGVGQMKEDRTSGLADAGGETSFDESDEVRGADESSGVEADNLTTTFTFSEINPSTVVQGLVTNAGGEGSVLIDHRFEPFRHEGEVLPEVDQRSSRAPSEGTDSENENTERAEQDAQEAAAAAEKARAIADAAAGEAAELREIADAAEQVVSDLSNREEVTDQDLIDEQHDTDVVGVAVAGGAIAGGAIANSETEDSLPADQVAELSTDMKYEIKATEIEIEMEIMRIERLVEAEAQALEAEEAAEAAEAKASAAAVAATAAEAEAIAKAWAAGGGGPEIDNGEETVLDKHPESIETESEGSGGFDHDLAELKEEITKYQRIITSLETGIKAFNGEITLLQTEITNAEGEINRLENILETHAKWINILNNNIYILTNELENWPEAEPGEEVREIHFVHIDNYDPDYGNATINEYTELFSHRNEALQRIQEYKEMIEEIKHKEGEIKEDINDLKEEIDNKKTLISDKKKGIQEHEEELKKLIIHLNSLQSMYDEMSNMEG